MNDEDLLAFSDLAHALSTGGYSIQSGVSPAGKWALCVVDKHGKRLPDALGVDGCGTIRRAMDEAVRQLDGAPLPGKVHRALETWRRRHETPTGVE